MAAVEVMPPMPEPHPRSPEVIDVDSLDDEEIRALQLPLQRQRLLNAGPPPEPLAFDVDDDVEYLGFTRTTAAPDSRNRIFSPPPPPAQPAQIPPVPPIPAHLRSFSSVPMRRRPPPHPSRPSSNGVVRPNDQPFAFEAGLDEPGPSRQQSPPIPPSARPAMWLGGAILSSNRDREGNGNAAPGRGILGMVSDLYHRIGFRDLAHTEDHDDDDEVDLFAALAGVHEPAIGSRRRGRRSSEASRLLGEVFANTRREAGTGGFGRWRFRTGSDDEEIVGDEYKPWFTHPGTVSGGFTWDFEPSSTPAEGQVPETTLVCAKCLEPLVLGDRGKERRIWGLRCGHLLDGKCVEDIMRPSSSSAPDLGKGKEKAVESEPEPEQELQNPIRSRLRPRPSSSVASSSRAVASSSRIYSHPYRRPRPPTHRSPRKPCIEAKFEWTCPVSGCGKVHLSVMEGGVWRMAEDKGAIGVYV